MLPRVSVSFDVLRRKVRILKNIEKAEETWRGAGIEVSRVSVRDENGCGCCGEHTFRCRLGPNSTLKGTGLGAFTGVGSRRKMAVAAARIIF